MSKLMIVFMWFVLRMRGEKGVFLVDGQEWQGKKVRVSNLTPEKWDQGYDNDEVEVQQYDIFAVLFDAIEIHVGVKKYAAAFVPREMLER